MSKRGGWLLIAVLSFAVPVALYWAGWLTRFEYYAADARAALLKHEVQSDIVIVGIDARSLAELNTWPWPRRFHATLLDRLRIAQPQRVFLDIDFSAASNAEDDALLSEALGRWDSKPVALAAFVQPSSASENELVLSKPLPVLMRNVELVSVNLQPSVDSLVRSFRSQWATETTQLPAVSTAMSGIKSSNMEAMPIDFSIAPSSFTFVSYVDLLRGQIDLADLKGKKVLVGATAVELGDIVPVPLYQAVPGVVLQALAIQTLAEGVPTKLPTLLYLSLLAGWTLLCVFVFYKRSWRHNLFSLLLGVALIAAASTYLYSTRHLIFEVAPFLLGTVLAFALITFKSLDDQTLRALAYAIGIRRRDALLASIVETSTDCIVCVDERGNIQTANPAAMQLFAAAGRSLIGMPIESLIPTLECAQEGVDALDALDGSVTESHARSLAGAEFPIDFSVSRVAFKDERLYTVLVRDITERKAQARKLEYQATHDPLTDLPNRAALATHLQQALAAHRPGETIALLMLDLCRFKEVNDTLGHGAGDSVLCEVARKFQDIVGASGFLARIGGDEFTLVLSGLGDAAQAQPQIDALAMALHEGMKLPVHAEAVAIELGLSIGIALFPQQASDTPALLKNADVAMYVAKQRGTAYEYYDPAYDEHSVRRLRMVAELRSALAENQLQLFYQPQVNLRVGKVISVEALTRWQHPNLGAVSPAEFMTIAESTDLIQPLTEWTLREALRQIAQWRAIGLELRAAVNLSARMLQNLTFPSRLQALLQSSGVHPKWLEVEITESAMMIDPARALRVLQDIHALGVYVSVDDYGTGFSSLGYLRDLPVHALKLDKSFVMQMREHAGNRAIVESTAQLAHALGLEVIAEGVETEWDANFLQRSGYDYAQGFHFSRAIRAEELTVWVRAFNMRGGRDVLPAA